MRITAEKKEKTREAILREARRLFAECGFEATGTREIAQAAGIASGTLFNYFQTKEAIVAALAAEALGAVPGAGDAETLEEDLFALVAMGMRKLRAMRKHLPALLETSLSPLAHGRDDGAASLRVAHLEAVGELARKHGFGELSGVALQLWWAQYTGVLVFWANDRSPKQEDTLALLDESVDMFVGWVRDQSKKGR